MSFWILIVLTAYISSIESFSKQAGNYNHETPKNIILFIADGFGINANVAYRLWKDVDATIFDEYLVGEYSTFSINRSVSDSANTATALASGKLTTLGQIGTDSTLNPIANILEAAKKRGKGVGVISNNKVTHATPAAFTAKSFQRAWENLMAEQQGTRIISNVDILFGGGKQHFIPQSNPDSDRNDDFDLISNFKDYGWKSLIQTKDELLSLTNCDIPAIGLFTDSNFPSYLSRKNNDELAQIPGLLEMTKKGLELLTANYDDTGFFIMIEAAQIDFAGHANDLASLVNEVDEYANTVDYVINDFLSKRDDDDTLVVMVSDHESGGLSLGRSSQWKGDAVQPGREGFLQTIDAKTNNGQSIYSFDFDPLISTAPNQCDGSPHDLATTDMYQFYIEPLNYPKMDAFTLSFLILQIQGDSDDFDTTFVLIEDFYIRQLSQEEKQFIISCYKRDRDPFFFVTCLTKILNVRCNAGWTTHGHTANDVRIYALGPASDRFKGWNGNIENIGNKLIDIFNVREEINIINDELKEKFINEIFQICDPSETLTNYGWNVEDSISWPIGNYRFPGFCVEEFM